MKDNLETYPTRDGQSLYYRTWMSGRDIIIYLHGMESHSHWFTRMASSLADEGLTVYGIDRRGSGLNEYQRGDIEDYNIFFNDIEDFLKEIKKRDAGKRVYLAGMCWGGILAVNYVSSGKFVQPDGLILLSPALYRKLDLHPLIKIFGSICSFFFPTMRFKIPIKDPMFTANNGYLEVIKNDKFRLRTLSARFFKEALRIEEDFMPVNHNISLPVCVLLAGHDQIVDNEKVKSWYDRLVSEDKVIRQFADAHHVLPFEPDIKPFVDFILNWIERKSE